VLRKFAVFAGFLALAGLLASAAAVGGGLGMQPARAAPLRQQDPIRVVCGPPEIPGWVVVNQFLAWSGCRTWECWSQWIHYDPSNALMEKVPRLAKTVHGGPDPGDPWPPYGYIFDPRAACADGERAAGRWYHNAFARPTFRYVRYPGEAPYLECRWTLEQRSRHSWSFAEDDQCLSCALDPTATPQATVCTEDPLHRPTAPPLTPTPLVLSPPEVEPRAFVHSSRIGSGGWYATVPGKHFFWPWQHYLDIRFSGKITEPQGTCAAESEISRYLFLGITDDAGGERRLCRMGGELPMPAYTRALDPSGEACPWVDAGEAVHLLFRKAEEPTPAEQPNSYFFWQVYPGAVHLHYLLEVVTTYSCTGEPAVRQAPWYFEETLTVYLTKSVLRR